nr:class I SAM-dependent methyltransferase [Magnetospirillum sulfuroxidans]
MQGRVLDFGCGRGRLCDLVPAERFVGLDADPTALAEARRLHPGYTFLHADQLDGQSGFDTIIAMAVIGYVADLPGLLSRFAARLNPGGRIVVTSPMPQADLLHRMGARLGIFGADTYDRNLGLPDRARIESAAALAGLKLAHYSRFMLGHNQIVSLVPKESGR